MERIVVWHFTDPGCPWAYSARPALAQLAWRFGDQLDWRLVTIGLSETTARLESSGYTPVRIAAGWPKFARRFGMPFGIEVKPRLSPTSRACRAIVAARAVDPDLGEAALAALQLLQFTTTGLLDEDEDLRAALAGVPGLDADAVVAAIDDPAVLDAYEADRARARTAAGTPTHVQLRHATSEGLVRYTAPSIIFEHPDGRSLEVGGFQPFESYDTALANLEPTLHRRRPPTDALAALTAFPRPLATAEIAAILRPSELEDADLAATRLELTALSGEGAVSCASAGGDAVWGTAGGGRRRGPRCPRRARRLSAPLPFPG
jgi:protein-disulfide isomerase-like protein with CxxC motif